MDARSCFSAAFGVVLRREADDIMDATLHRENGVHDVKGGADVLAGVVQDLDGQGSRPDLLAVEAEWRRDHIEGPGDAFIVHEHHRPAVRRRVVEGRDSCFPAEALGAGTHRMLVAAKVDVLAGEGSLFGNSGTRGA
jgi:hypothetical protein